MSTNTSESAALLAQYVNAAEAYGEAVEADDPERARAAQAAIQAALQELVARDQTRTVLSLLDDGRLAVRYCAAVDALDFAPARAESVENKVSGTISAAVAIAAAAAICTRSD